MRGACCPSPTGTGSYLLQLGGELESELKRAFWGGLLAGVAVAGVVYMYTRGRR